LSADQIWDSTIRELFRELVVAVRRAREDVQHDKALAYYVAALSRLDRLPPLERWLAVLPRRQTVAQQRHVVEHLSERLGIPLRRTRLVRVTREGSTSGG
jgi:hypothetical protein